ncbi:MAG TPA: expansin EXLX1 family cellulose-binding protein, partial [Acidimicrobiales bacterium]
MIRRRVLFLQAAVVVAAMLFLVLAVVVGVVMTAEAAPVSREAGAVRAARAARAGWATPAADVVPRSGTATFTDLTGGGACSFPGEPPDNLHVGLSTAEFGHAEVCGAYLDVTGPKGTVRVQVTDHCRRCPEGTIDITRKAFARIADVDAGVVPVHYELVRDPAAPGPLAVRVKDGSSAWF